MVACVVLAWRWHLHTPLLDCLYESLSRRLRNLELRTSRLELIDAFVALVLARRRAGRYFLDYLARSRVSFVHLNKLAGWHRGPHLVQRYLVVFEKVGLRFGCTQNVANEATFRRVLMITPTDALFLLNLIFPNWREFHAPSHNRVETARRLALRNEHTPRIPHREAVLAHADADVVLARARIDAVYLHVISNKTARLLIFAEEYLFGLLRSAIEDDTTLRKSVDAVLTLVPRVFDEVLDGHTCLVAVTSAGSLCEHRPAVMQVTLL